MLTLRYVLVALRSFHPATWVLSLLALHSLQGLVHGQTASVYESPQHDQSGAVPQRLPPLDSSPQTLEEAWQRLRETEARLAALESSFTGQLPPPAYGVTPVNYDYYLAPMAENSAVPMPMEDKADKKDDKKEEKKKEEPPKPKKWFEKYSIRGYAQFRINETVDEEFGSAQYVGDSSVGDNQSFLIRRARLILFGDVTDRISIYFQPDFASTPNGSTDAIQFAQIRDWYADLHFNEDKVHRIRVGQSKIPYGWENMQSSQNRLALDRNDAMNSAVRNERDLGAFYYWTPEYAQDTFKFINDEGLKGSGNYGVFALGAYNGQGGSLREQNDDLHVITRLTLPRTLDNGQIVEAGVQAYTGMYSVLSSRISPLGIGPTITPAGTLEAGNNRGIIDKRIAGTFVYYPQPLGFQAEWTVGRGPGLNDAQTAVEDRALYGGYVQTMYRYKSPCHGEFWPFARWNHFKGGYKSERNAPFSEINEWELGLEWQMSKNLEFVSMYTWTDRTNTRALSTADTLSYEQFEGQLARFQLQVNY